MKFCKKCQTEKELEEFYKNSETLDGCASSCKKCSIRQSIELQRLNRARCRAAGKRWRLRHPEKVKENAKKKLEQRRANPEKYRELRRRYPKPSPDKKTDQDLRRNFGISLMQYKEILKQQSGVCAICERSEKYKKRLAVDHCHATGKIRGLLCQDCNQSLGKFYDSPKILRRAADYLEKAPAVETNKNQN